MMRLLIVFALALSCQVIHAEKLILSGDNVASQNIVIPDDYPGVVSLTFYPLETEDVIVCGTWLVPAEAPEDAPLNETWSLACPFFRTIPAGGDAISYPVLLRSSTNVLSAALKYEDSESDGYDDAFEFSYDIDFEDCPPGTSGPDCTPYTTVDYNTDISVNGSAVLRLPTFYDAQPENFLQALFFQISNSEEEATNIASVTYRLNGPVAVTRDGGCPSLSTCNISLPPFSSVSGIFWELNVVGEVKFRITPKYCSSGKIGAKCKKSYTVFNNAPGVPTIRTGNSTFIFKGADLNVAVGGLDGYEQEDHAPSIYVQVDQIPGARIYLSSGVNSKANRLGFSLAGIVNVTEDTRFVVNVVVPDTKTSYGIWIPINETDQCAYSCTNRGNCSDYVCECEGDDKYNGLGCEHVIKNFTIEYIILIAVGGLLVLSIVIGVPIYCWMNRQQDYETIE